LIYDATPPVMGRYAQRVRALGACFIGGCCGNGPDHIAAIAEALRSPLSEADRAALNADMAESSGNGAAEPRRPRANPSPPPRLGAWYVPA
jgi:hypothetical protein